MENQYLSYLDSDAKKERIDKQYYVTTEKDEVTKDSAKELFLDAENFLLKMKLVIKNLNNEDIDEIRENFVVLVSFLKASRKFR